MDRVQALKLLKEIADKIPELGPQALSIVETEPNNPLQTGCTISFKGLSNESIDQLKIIVENRSLAILDNKTDLTIYSPLVNA
jgi:hypothetical protein